MAEDETPGFDLIRCLGPTLKARSPDGAADGAEDSPAAVVDVDTKEALAGKVAVGFLFGDDDANDKELTASLVKAWEVLSGKGLQIVYVPPEGFGVEAAAEDGDAEEGAPAAEGAAGDAAGEEAAIAAACAEMPWLVLPRSRSAEIEELYSHFGSEPRLVIVSPDRGVVWTDNGAVALAEDAAGDQFPEGPWGGPPAPPKELTEHEIMVKLGSIAPDPGESGIKGIFITAKNYMGLGLLDQVEEDDDIAFSGPKLRPYVTLKKSAVLEEVKKMGFASDYHPQQKDFEKFQGETILLMFDQEKRYGDKIVWATTADSYKREWDRITALRTEIVEEFEQIQLAEAARKAGGGGGGGGGGEGGVGGQADEPEENIVVRDLPKECKEWVSETAEATHIEVSNFTWNNSRPILQVMVTRPRVWFGKSCKFSDSGENLNNCKGQKDPNFGAPKKELELGIQAVKETRTCACQTTWFRPVNKSTQYSPSDFLHREADLGYDKVEELSLFLSAVSVAVEEALQTNETVDIFQEEFAHLGEEEAGAANKTHTNIKEHRNFHDVTYTKGKRIEWVEWVPNSTDMLVSSCCENLPFAERLDNSGKASVSTILVWSFQDSLSPHAILLAPWEVTVFKFYPSDSKYLIGGLGNGQIAVWKLADADLGHAVRDKKGNASGAGNAVEEEKNSTIPTVLHKQISMIDESHKKAVMAIEFLPATLEVERRGKGASEKNPADGPVKYFLTIAGDGQVAIWDFQALLDAINDNDFIWKPVLKVQLQRQDSGTEMGLCHILHCHDRFDEKGNKLLTNFYASTEEGELVYGDWAARAEEDRKADVVKRLYPMSKTFRPMLSLERSPFFPDILLGVTDWAFYLYKDGLSQHLFQSSYTSTYFTRGVWSPTRPSVIFLGLVSGGIDIWDFSDQSHKASLSDSGASVSISSMVFLRHGDMHTDQKLAVGDVQGHLHVHNIPKNLVKQAGRELDNMRKFLDREENRVNYFQERHQQLKELKETMEKQAQTALDSATEGVPGKAAVDEEKLDEAAENAYRKLERDCKEELGL